MATMNRFYPETGTTEEWNAAYYRLEDYFRAHHVTNKIHQSQIILRLLQRAAAKHALAPERVPSQLALEEAYEVMDAWFQRLLPDEPASRAAAVGRVGMLILDATERWPHHFLADEGDVPAEFRESLRELFLQTGPDLNVSSMVPRPLDAAPPEGEIDETWDKVSRVSVAVLIGLALLLAGGTVYYFAQ